jgi:selenide,water dikinase
MPPENDPRLLVGTSTADDAGVYLVAPDLALIQTLDFFTPIVNDPYLFGKIAATNALSDVYAMGGKPVTALNICCFPIKAHPPEVFRDILRGGADQVHAAGAVIAGGHSVEDEDLKYGLSVTGVVHPDKLVTNAGLKPGQILVLTKPLGTGVIATAYKAGLAAPEAVEASVREMTSLNLPAAEVMEACGVKGGTDVTGFGLLGHALEMAAASGVRVVIEANKVPVLPQAREMALTGLVPLGSHANRNYCHRSLSYQGETDDITLDLLSDAQTSGGMLMGLDPDQVDRALDMLGEKGVRGAVMGRVEEGPPGTALVVF